MTREEKVRKAQELRNRGLKLREIGEEMGYAITTVHGWLNDPDRSKEIARKNSYRGQCEICGKRTTGSDGPGQAPKRCVKHVEVHLLEHEKAKARKAEMIRLRHEGLRNMEIAERLGTTPVAVATALYQAKRIGMAVDPSPYWKRGKK